MLRWTVFYRFGVKVTFHHFLPNTDDKDPHDHPSPFVTLVLKGGYWNTEFWQDSDEQWLMRRDWVGFGFHYRKAEHMHITVTDERGAWTFVVMGPKERGWGFLRLMDQTWWPYREYVEKFGGTIRCDTDDGDRSHELEHYDMTHRDYKTSKPPE